eukprot:COSAG05_NODE_13022_length_444_cov_1.649275_2_plen_34_part_01
MDLQYERMRSVTNTTRRTDHVWVGAYVYIPRVRP